MPELPEVETVRRALARALLGRTLERPTLLRHDILTGDPSPKALLSRARVVAIDRRGKNLALLADNGRILGVHLGMTGRLLVQPANRPDPPHTHARWTIIDPDRRSPRTLLFADPRRFGGLTTHADPASLDIAWAHLGPDALTIDPELLLPRLRATRRALKAALLDQSVLAGVGNIYADEALFAARLGPRRRACTLRPEESRALVLAIHRTLHAAIRAGGSTIRTYADPAGRPGRAQRAHAVYGRAGEPCFECQRPLRAAVTAGRTTVWCSRCQPTRVPPPAQRH